MGSKYDSATKELLSVAGEICLTDTESLYQHSFDSLKISFSPEVVIRPTKAEQIEVVLKLANQHCVPITPKGVGSSLTGSATPIIGGWVLDLSKLNHIQIDPLLRTADVGAGAVTKDIQDAADVYGLFYPPDPSSYKWCTIGGNIACNAGGLRCVKYGVTRDYILSLKGYLPTGEFVEWAKPVRKFATGFNIRDLWIGSEGMLGIITSATLKLIPKPKTTRTLLCGFSHEEDAITAIQDLLKTEITPSIIEFIDELSVKGAEETVGYKFFDHIPNTSVALLEIDGNTETVETEYRKLIDWAKQYAVAFTEAKEDAEVEALWEVRRKCSGAMFKHGNTKLNEDIVVPIDRLTAIIQHIRNIRSSFSIPIAVFGHAGDGNLHVNIMYNHEDSDMTNRARLALDSLMEKVITLNGAISGEHGVGLAKSHFVSSQFSPTQLQLMKNIKKVFDPNGILNPGKFFTAFSPWKHKKQIYKFPWDKK